MNRTRWIIAGVVLLSVLAGGWIAAGRVYRTPMRVQRAALADEQSRVDGMDALMQRLTPARVLRESIGPTTLGNDEATVSHWLRTLLSDAASGQGLRAVVVDHGRPQVQKSPAAARSAKLGSALRRRIDDGPQFFRVLASVRGEGSLEEIMRTVAVLQAQPWLHRIDGVKIEPANRERTAFSLRADVATLFMPGLRSTRSEEPTLVPASAVDIDRAIAIASGNPFVVPPSVAPPVEAVVRVERKEPEAAEPPQPVVPAYAAWRVAGIIEPADGDGAQVIVVDGDRGSSRTLRVGEALHNAVFEGVDGNAVFFRIGGVSWFVDIGDRLGDGRAVEGSVDS
jgi:hypothetical protein